MPIFFQQDIDESTKLAIWEIEEDETFFLQHVPLQRDITHPHKRLQHLAGRYLLQYLFPDFPISLIKIADTRKPFLEDEAYHFSISHCSNYAAAIVSSNKRVGVDIEVPTQTVARIQHKFLNHKEWDQLHEQWVKANDAGVQSILSFQTLLWSSKEAMFKWWGLGDVDFKKVLHLSASVNSNSLQLAGQFTKDDVAETYPVEWKSFASLMLAWVITEPSLHHD